MSSGSTVTANPQPNGDAVPSQWSATPTGRFTPFLSHLTDGASVMDLDPTACIPLCLIRGLSDNAILRLMSIFNGDANEDQHAVALTGMFTGTPTSLVVPLVDSLSYLVEETLSKTFEDPIDLKFNIESHRKWYGIIDGNQFHGALMRLRVKIPAKWEGVKWKVIVLRPGHELSEYRKLAVVQNERNKQLYHYETTLPDMLISLRNIYDDLYTSRLKASRTGKKGVSVHHRDVAHIYDGGDHEKNTTVRQAVSVATRLTRATIEAISTIASMTCEDIILSSAELNKDNLKSVSLVMSTYDCRLFRKFLCTSTLRGARHFMNASREGEDVAQENAVHRARHWSELNGFRSVKSSVLNEQFMMAKLSLIEERKFLEFIDEDTWPRHMDTIKENMLRTTICDKELQCNQGNSADILPSLWKCFKRLYPGRARGIETDAANDKRTESERSPDNDSSSPPTPPTENISENSENEKMRQEELAKQRELERQKQMRSDADAILDEHGIQTFGLPFDDFATTVWNSKSKRVDLVLTAIPSGVDNSPNATNLASFCKSVLKTGSYVFLILSQSMYSDYYHALSAAGFKVCDHAFSILYDTTTIKRRKTVDFPQNHCEIALVARSKGHHPSNFQPDFMRPQNIEEDSDNQSYFASFLNVEACTNKLKRPSQNSCLFPDERSVRLYSRIISTFSPPHGFVIDPIAGPLTTSLACLDTCRRCISLSPSDEALNFAVGRLRVYASPSATMQSLEMYSGPPSTTIAETGVVQPFKKRKTAPRDGEQNKDIEGLSEAGDDRDNDDDAPCMQGSSSEEIINNSTEIGELQTQTRQSADITDNDIDPQLPAPIESNEARASQIEDTEFSDTPNASDDCEIRATRKSLRGNAAQTATNLTSTRSSARLRKRSSNHGSDSEANSECVTNKTTDIDGAEALLSIRHNGKN